ncbi:hypothetical protein D3C87_1239890 [compost metagenome]
MKLLVAFVPFLIFAVLEHRVGPHIALVAATAASAVLVVDVYACLHPDHRHCHHPRRIGRGSLVYRKAAESRETVAQGSTSSFPPFALVPQHH